MPVNFLSLREREGAAKPRKGEGELMHHYRKQPSGTVDRARALRRAATPQEKKLLRGLREHLPQHKWRFQMPLGPFYADFACFAERLVIEADGGQHGAALNYDASRSGFMEREGYRVLRFWNHEIVDNLEGVLMAVAEALSPSPSQPSAGPLPLPGGEEKS